MKLHIFGELRSVVEKDYEFGGNSGKTYSLTFEQDGTSYYLKTTKEIYHLFKNKLLEKGREYTFVAKYSPAFKSIRIEDVVE